MHENENVNMVFEDFKSLEKHIHQQNLDRGDLTESEQEQSPNERDSS